MPKPKGRTLDEFLDDWGRLLPAEQRLLEASAKGDAARIAGQCPDRMTDTNRVRAAFLRFLALGGDERACVHEAGPHLKGAWISGKLDFEACDIPRPITLDWCHIDGNLILRDAKLPALFLERSWLGKLDAERLDCRGSVRINDCVAYGQVSFTSARIGGDIDCVGSHFFDDRRDCFQCDGAKIEGDLTLGHAYSDESFFAHGSANFSAADIDGDVRCNAAQFEGEVWFIGTRIKGDIDFSRCILTYGAERSELVLTRAEISGRLFFRKVTGIVRRITLRGASVAALVDDIASWTIADELLLDGFRYSRFIDTEIQDGTVAWVPHKSPTSSEDRIRWLDLQDEQDFKPQPWEQLIKVLRETGYQDGAKTVAIAKQTRIHKSKAGAQALHRIYGVLCGYGYRPARLIAWAAGVAVVWAVFFWAAGSLGVMTPTDWRLVASIKDPDCRPESGGNWTTCQKLHRRGYESFNPIVYSIDLIVPVIATQQTKDWAPATTLQCDRTIYGLCEHAAANDAAPRAWLLGLIFWLLARIETLAGWALGLMFIAIVSGLIKKD